LSPLWQVLETGVQFASSRYMREPYAFVLGDGNEFPTVCHLRRSYTHNGQWHCCMLLKSYVADSVVHEQQLTTWIAT
jgi:hypothetical protein